MVNPKRLMEAYENMIPVQRESLAAYGVNYLEHKIGETLRGLSDACRELGDLESKSEEELTDLDRLGIAELKLRKELKSQTYNSQKEQLESYGVFNGAYDSLHDQALEGSKFVGIDRISIELDEIFKKSG